MREAVEKCEAKQGIGFFSRDSSDEVWHNIDEVLEGADGESVLKGVGRSCQETVLRSTSCSTATSSPSTPLPGGIQRRYKRPSSSSTSKTDSVFSSRHASPFLFFVFSLYSFQTPHHLYQVGSSFPKGVGCTCTPLAFSFLCLSASSATSFLAVALVVTARASATSSLRSTRSNFTSSGLSVISNTDIGKVSEIPASTVICPPSVTR